MCHGKRRCTLNASSSTFGNPCSPQSHLYLRVVYTCGNECFVSMIHWLSFVDYKWNVWWRNMWNGPLVSRRILKDHYQGELEEDEVPDHQNSFDNEDLMSENSFESEDYAEPVSSATPIPPRHVAAQDDASNYDNANNYRTTDRPFGDQQAKRGGFIGKFFCFCFLETRICNWFISFSLGMTHCWLISLYIAHIVRGSRLYFYFSKPVSPFWLAVINKKSLSVCCGGPGVI
jgi:hypothetical protein